MTVATHPVTPQELMALLDGELSAERAHSVSSHTESCADCQQAFASFRHTSRSLTSWTVGEAPSQIESGVHASSRRIASELLNRGLRIFPSRRRRWVLGLAAAALLFVLLAGTVGRHASELSLWSARGSAYQHEKGMREVSEMNLPPADRLQSTGHGSGFGKGPATDQQSKVFRNQIPGDDVVALARPGVATDTNGLMHGLGDHAQNSFSLDGQPQTYSGPMIARTASLVVVVKDFNASRARIDGILARHDGYAASMTVNTPEEAARSLQASLRVPVPQLAATMAELKVLGRVETENRNGEEVTQQHADLVARLKISRETEQRFMSILRDWKGDINQALSAEQAIARVRGEIEQMEAEQKNLERRVDFAAIDLRLSEEYKLKLDSGVPSFSTQFHNAAVNGYRNIADTLVALILFFAEYGPVLIFWAILLLIPAWLVWRRWRQAVTVTPAT